MAWKDRLSLVPCQARRLSGIFRVRLDPWEPELRNPRGRIWLAAFRQRVLGAGLSIATDSGSRRQAYCKPSEQYGSRLLQEPPLSQPLCFKSKDRHSGWIFILPTAPSPSTELSLPGTEQSGGWASPAVSERQAAAVPQQRMHWAIRGSGSGLALCRQALQWPFKRSPALAGRQLRRGGSSP